MHNSNQNRDILALGQVGLRGQTVCEEWEIQDQDGLNRMAAIFKCNKTRPSPVPPPAPAASRVCEALTAKLCVRAVHPRQLRSLASARTPMTLAA